MASETQENRPFRFWLADVAFVCVLAMEICHRDFNAQLYALCSYENNDDEQYDEHDDQKRNAT